MGTIGRLTVITGVLLGTTVPPAAAAPPPPLILGATATAFGPTAPKPPTGSFRDPQDSTFPGPVVVTGDGDALAVRTRVHAQPDADFGFYYDSEIEVAGRLAGRTAFGPAQTVEASGGVQRPAVATRADGAAALAFAPGDAVYGQPPAVAMRDAGRPFGPVRDLPRPADSDQARFDTPAVALAGDGAAAVIACERNSSRGTARILLWARPPQATAFLPPRVLGRCERALINGHDTASLAADDRGGLVALWTGPRDGAPDDGPPVVWVSTRPRGGVFGGLRSISGPLQPPPDASPIFPSLPAPLLRVGPRGDALAVWNGATTQIGVTTVAVRPAGGRWSAPQVLTPPDSAGGYPAAAVNARGDMAVVWDTGTATEGAFRRAGGSFGRVTGSAHGNGLRFFGDVALTAKGTTVMVRGPGDDQSPGLVTRTPGGRWGPPQRFSPDGVVVRVVSLATDRAGNGTMLWSADGPDAYGAANATVFTDAPPSLTEVRLTAKALHLRSSEPVRLTLTARAGRRLARQRRTQVKDGRTTVVRLTAALRSVLSHSGASVTVRVQDAGGAVVSHRVRPR